jgi:dienelactone hydrolase
MSRSGFVLFIVGLILFTTGFSPLALMRFQKPSETFTATTVDNVLIRYDVTRKANTSVDAPLAILLHGFSGNRVMMRMMALALAESGFICVSVDLRGHGSSEGMMGLRDDFVKDIQAVILSLRGKGVGNLTRIVLLGHSMGGGVVLNPLSQGEAVVATIGVAPVSYPEWVNTTTPKNLLLITSTADAVINGAVVKQTFYKAVNGTLELNETHSIHGTARKLFVIEGVDHLNILYNEEVIGEIVAWSTKYLFGKAQTLTSSPNQIHIEVYISLAGGTLLTLAALSLVHGKLWPKKRTSVIRVGVDRRALLKTGFIATLLAGILGSLLALVISFALMLVTPFFIANLMTALFLGNSIILGGLTWTRLRKDHKDFSYLRFVKESIIQPSVKVDACLGLIGAAALTGLLSLTVGSTTTATFSTASMRLITLPLYTFVFSVVFTFYESFFKGWVRPMIGDGGVRRLYAMFFQLIVLISTFMLELIIITTILSLFLPYVQVDFFFLGLNHVLMSLGIATVTAEVLYERTGGWIAQIIISAFTFATMTIVFSPALRL